MPLTTSSAGNIGAITSTLTRRFPSNAIMGVKPLSTARAQFLVIPEIDIWRAAKLYSEKALDESAARADELVAHDDHNGAAVWRRITDAVGQLQNNAPPGLLH